MAWKVEAVLQVIEIGNEASPILVGGTSDFTTAVTLAEELKREAVRDLALAEAADPVLALVARGHLAEVEALCRDLSAYARKVAPRASDKALTFVPPLEPATPERGS